jgi:valacyclovir hydrolase
MAQLGADRYSVLGWSDGGITGFILAASQPDHVQKLVAFGSKSYVTQYDKTTLRALRDIKKWEPNHRAVLEQVYGKEGLQSLWGRFVDENYDQFGDICSQDLALIKCPTLLIHGDRDVVIAKEHPAFLVQKIAGSRLHRFPEGKHNCHLQFPKLFNELVQQFLLQKPV